MAVNNDGIETAINDDLRRLTIEGLRQQWRNLSGRGAAPALTRALLIRLIAYHRQAVRHGNLLGETERLLTQIAARDASDRGFASSASASLTVTEAARTVGADRRYAPSTILVREWQGRLHRVAVMKDGFAWNGTTYASLSRVAREITGTAWNGHVFFGGRDRGLATRRERANRAGARASSNTGPAL